MVWIETMILKIYIFLKYLLMFLFVAAFVHLIVYVRVQNIHNTLRFSRKLIISMKASDKEKERDMKEVSSNMSSALMSLVQTLIVEANKKTHLENNNSSPTITRNRLDTETTFTESVNSNTNHDVNKTALPFCDEKSPDLGPIIANKTEIELVDVEKKYPEVHWGGWYSPPNCRARHKVAIIVPFRDRYHHLGTFLNHMHPFLIKQQLEYGIFIIEQYGQNQFNRAKLMNVGFKESNKLGSWQCFVFHDIDLLPLDERNIYSCPRQPRHMSIVIDKYNFELPYPEQFGGISAMTLEQFTKVNGFSNRYWGWGGEDDDMYYRLEAMNYHIARYTVPIARYAALLHKKAKPNPKRFRLLKRARKVFRNDGISNLQYCLLEINFRHLYTHIVVNIDEPKCQASGVPLFTYAL